MEFHSGLNLMLEALAYLGRRAGGFGPEWMLERLRSRGVTDTASVERVLEPVVRLTKILDRAVKVEPERLAYLFGNLTGFPYNTIGSFSRGFLMLYPMVSRFRGCCDEALAQARSRTDSRLAGDLAMMLDLGEEPELSGGVLADRVLSLNVSAESKVAVLELYHRGEPVLVEAMALVKQVVTRLERELPLMEACCGSFVSQLREHGPERVLNRTSSLNSNPGRSDVVRPFLFGMDTLLAVTPEDSGPVQVYCGILRGELQMALASAKEPQMEVCEAIRLLADQTRFDIVCHLRDQDAYGQELAAKFGLSRNTIHHHMSKLLAAHLVKGTVDGNRVYYRVDESSVRQLLSQLGKLLLPE